MGNVVASLYGRVCATREWLKKRIPTGSLLFRALRPLSQLVEKAFPVYRRLSGDSVFYRESELTMSSLSCPRILDKTIELFKPTSVLDIGCGTGVSMDYLIGRGIPAASSSTTSTARSR